MSNKYLIGWSEVDITPDKKISLAGQFYERVSEYVETPITATAMAVSSGDEYVIICSADLASVENFLMKEIRARLAVKCPKLDTDRVIVTATHTHTSFTYANRDKNYDDSGYELDVLRL